MSKVKNVDSPGTARVSSKFPEQVEMNLRKGTGQRVLLSLDGILHEHFHDPHLFIGKYLENRLKQEQGWIEELVRHAPSVGAFYEDSLSSIVREYLPSKYKVGRGFVYDPLTRRSSRQIDILVYDCWNEAPLFERGQFVVITSSNLIKLAEVKKALKLEDVRQIIKNNFSSSVICNKSSDKRLTKYLIFAFGSKSSTQKIFDTVIESIESVAKKLLIQKESNRVRMYGLENVVLPKIYFLDRDEYIDCELISTSLVGIFEVEVSILRSGTESGLGEFLDYITMDKDFSWHNENRTFRSNQFIKIEKKKVLESKLCLLQAISMYDLFLKFKNEKDTIQSFRINGQKPTKAIFPISIELDSFSTFAEFCRNPMVNWTCVPYEKIGNSEE